MNNLLKSKMPYADYVLFNPFSPELKRPELLHKVDKRGLRLRHSLDGLANYHGDASSYTHCVNYYNFTGHELVVEEASGLTSKLRPEAPIGTGEAGYLYISIIQRRTIEDLVKAKLEATPDDLPDYVKLLVKMQDAILDGSRESVINRYAIREANGFVTTCLEFRISAETLTQPVYFEPAGSVIGVFTDQLIPAIHPHNRKNRVVASVSAIPKSLTEIEPEIEKMDGFFEVVKIVDKHDRLANKYYLEREDKVYPVVVSKVSESDDIQEGVWVVTSGSVTSGEMQPTASVEVYPFEDCFYQRDNPPDKIYPLRIYDSYDNAHLRKRRESEKRKKELEEREERIKQRELELTEMKQKFEERENSAKHNYQMKSLATKERTEDLKLWPAILGFGIGLLGLAIKILV